LQQVPLAPLRHQPLAPLWLHRLLHPPQVLRHRLLVAVATAGLNPAH
jgi:hypothetical protein